MTHSNVEVVRRAFEAYNRGDLDAAVADFAPDCEYVASGAIPGADAVSTGPEGYKRFVSWLQDEFDDARVEIRELDELGERVLTSIEIRGRGKQSGAETSWTVWQLWTLHDGKFVHGEGFTTRESAMEAARLRS